MSPAEGTFAVIAVAVLLLPGLGLLLYAMDRVEDWMAGRPRAAHRARGRHLRLVHSTSRHVIGLIGLDTSTRPDRVVSQPPMGLPAACGVRQQPRAELSESRLGELSSLQSVTVAFPQPRQIDKAGGHASLLRRRHFG
ncbi:hypothetical protein B1R27_00655 [Streptomyces sp. GKU 895]|nr:hypothetical protein B1R27_00655 [Streptomyces sp. GKU 895]